MQDNTKAKSKLDAHYRAIRKLVGAREALDNAHIGTSIIWYVRPGSANADVIRMDAVERGLKYSVPWRDVDEVVVSENTKAAQLIKLSVREGRTVTEYPRSRADAVALLEDLGAECADDCCPQEYQSGHYDVWGTTSEGEDWRVHVVYGEIA